MKNCPVERQARIVTNDEYPSPDHRPADLQADAAFSALGLDPAQ
jgi:hypothetical protein